MEKIRRLVFVVARDRRALYASLRRTFAADEAVDVVLDRRANDRRRASQPANADRRRLDRRVDRDADRKVRERGYAVVLVATRRARAARRGV